MLTKEQIIGNLRYALIWNDKPEKEVLEEVLKIVIKALEQEPCDDAISRREAISIASICTMSVDDVVAMIKALPPVNPQPKKIVGKLISVEVLDKIRAELHATAEMHEDGDYYLRDEWIDEIFDKYKAESEDKE